ncbi:Trafficking protein particle complex subunit 12, partial [Rhizopus stolonifer]
KTIKGPEAMVMNNMWRSIAKYARQQIMQSDPTQVQDILKLWHMRLLALTKLGLCQLASAEFEKLGDLDRPELTDPVTHVSIVPFELRMLFATLPSHLKYPALALERITLLVVYCKKMQRQSDDSVWKQREIQTYLVLATHWIHIKDYSSAANTMELILTKAPDQVDVLSGLGRLYLQMGDMESANRMFDRMESLYGEQDHVKEALETNRALAYMAQGEWSQARDILQKNKDNLMAMNNLGVCEVYLGHLAKAIDTLETLTANNPTSAGTCETAITNMYSSHEASSQMGW